MNRAVSNHFQYNWSSLWIAVIRFGFKDFKYQICRLLKHAHFLQLPSSVLPVSPNAAVVTPSATALTDSLSNNPFHRSKVWICFPPLIFFKKKHSHTHTLTPPFFRLISFLFRLIWPKCTNASGKKNSNFAVAQNWIVECRKSNWHRKYHLFDHLNL